MRAGPILFTVSSILLLAVFAGLGPSVAAQSALRVLILHDVKDDGYTYVGNPNQFAFMLINEDGKTNVHKNAHILVRQNGVTLYETGGSDTAHDYDALNPFVVTFPSQGPYDVEAEVNVATGNVMKASFHGFAERRADLIPITVKAEQTIAPSGQLSNFTFTPLDAAGAIVAHSDGLFEVRRASDNFLLFRIHTHTHETPQVAEFAFPDQGDYVVRFIAYEAFPTRDGPAFAPVATVLNVKVSGAAGPMRPAPAMGVGARPGPAGSGFLLLDTYDPAPPAPYDGYPNVGPYGNVRLNALVYDPATKTMVPHVDFTATLKDPDGKVLFQSQTLHEYDGHLEVVTQQARQGTYTLSVTADRGDWKASRDLKFNVVPPVLATGGAGPLIVRSTGLDGVRAGEPQNISFTAQTLAGTAYQHSEIEMQIVRGAKLGAPMLINKLHTHSDGKFAVAATFPEPGDYFVVLDPETLDGEPSVSYSYEKLGNSLIVPVKVAPGVALADVGSMKAQPLATGAKGFAPGLGFLLILLGLSVALGFRGRST
jgi:hypothetical protein